MMSLSYGDLAGNFLRRIQNTDLRMRMEKLAKEMTTGTAADPARHLGGDYSQLSGIRHELRQLDAYAITAQEAQLRSSVAQAALGEIGTLASDLSADILKTSGSATGGNLEVLASGADQAFRATVRALNSRAAGQGLFGGAATDTAALADAGEMLDDLRAAVAGETTYLGYIQAIDDWFDTPGGGFETDGYLGSAADAPALLTEDGARLSIDIRADETLFRDVLKGFAKAALATDPALSFDSKLSSDLIFRGAEELLSNTDRITAARADLGWVEERVENAITRNAASRAAMNKAYNDVLGVDEYQAASELQDTQYRLEALYTLTVRLSSLSLVEFLR